MPKPRITVDYKGGGMKPIVTIHDVPGGEVYYTTDGTEPTKASIRYAGPISFDKSATLKAIAYPHPGLPQAKDLLSSLIVATNIKVYSWKKATKVSGAKQGIRYKYFEPAGKIDISSINGTATSSGIVDIISNAKKQRPDKFAFEFSGYINIDKDGIYTFFTDSDDGSKLYIDEEETVNNDGDHGNVEKSGKAALKKGYHKIRVVYFDSGGGNSLKVSMQPENGKKEIIAASLLFH